MADRRWEVALVGLLVLLLAAAGFGTLYRRVRAAPFAPVPMAAAGPGGSAADSVAAAPVATAADPAASAGDSGATPSSPSPPVVEGPYTNPARGERLLTASLPQDAMLVYVSGAVSQPGVYVLAKGRRVVDAIQVAGGPTEAAALEALNLAAPLHDGDRLHVPTRADVRSAGRPAGGTGSASGSAAPAGSATPWITPASAGPAAGGPRIVNINTADARTLETLPGIGPALAARIVADREARGPYARPEDLKRVTGIGDKNFEALRNLITTD